MSRPPLEIIKAMEAALGRGESDLSAYFHDDFVWAYLDADEPKNRPLMAKLGARSIPFIGFLRPDGSPIGHFAGGVSAEQFTEILDRVKVDAKKPAESETK